MPCNSGMSKQWSAVILRDSKLNFKFLSILYKNCFKLNE
jgi:hypothetical protein